MDTENNSGKDERTELYLKQKRLLETFLKTGAISKEQFEKSLDDMTEKMGMQEMRNM